jgi:hypothetical protein
LPKCGLCGIFRFSSSHCPGNQPEKEDIKMAKQEHKVIPFTGNGDELPPAA